MAIETIPCATSVKQIWVNGGNLFRIALDQLGDALQWTRIAQANGLRDPFLPVNTPIKLKIPLVNPAADDSGILNG